ncbi:MAG: hypothetical protein ACOY7U_00225 [Acidobacteriota bacterium]
MRKPTANALNMAANGVIEEISQRSCMRAADSYLGARAREDHCQPCEEETLPSLAKLREQRAAPAWLDAVAATNRKHLTVGNEVG